MKMKAKDGKLYAEVTLRYVVERCDVSDSPILSEFKRLYDENDKLRELVCGLNWCTESPDGPRVDCEHCPLGVVEGKPLELACEVMMRELGVEVKE